MDNFTDTIDKIKKDIKDKVEKEQVNSQPQDQQKVSDNDLKEFCKIINYPYDLLADNLDEDFRLSDVEKDINEQLAYMTMIYYLPSINLGKLSIWLLLLFNTGMLGLKTLKYIKNRKEMKKMRELLDLQEQEKQQKSKPQPQTPKIFEPEIPEPKDFESKIIDSKPPDPESKPKNESEIKIGRKRGRPKKLKNG